MPAHRAANRSLLGSLSSLTTKQQLAGGGSILAVIAVVVVLLATGVFSSSKTSTTKNQAGSTTTIAPIVTTRCPLTDLPAPGGVPQRPAIAVKIGNEPDGARPQSGLNEADIVYDTPAEGFIMRYVAVFQCNLAPSIGPTRSVRWVDWHIVQEFGSPILAFAGGIDPDVNTVMGLSWLHPANLLEGGQAAGHRISSRVAPDNLYTSSAALYSLYSSDKTAPNPVFTITKGLPASAVATTGLAINFSGGTDVRWTWDAKSHSWLHGYTSGPDFDAWNNKRVSTTNIVVQSSTYTFGPYIESPGGSGDVMSVTTGSGPGYILRDGKSIAVTWHRAGFTDATTYTDAAGNPIGLAPGRTWVEIVPDTTFKSSSAFQIEKASS